VDNLDDAVKRFQTPEQHSTLDETKEEGVIMMSGAPKFGKSPSTNPGAIPSPKHRKSSSRDLTVETSPKHQKSSSRDLTAEDSPRLREPRRITRRGSSEIQIDPLRELMEDYSDKEIDKN